MEAPWIGNPPEPQEEYECDQCGRELLKGQTACEDKWRYEYYCSVDCYLKQRGFTDCIVGD